MMNFYAQIKIFCITSGETARNSKAVNYLSIKKNSVCSEHHSLTGLLEPQNHKSSVVSVELYFNGFKKERNKHTKNPPKFLFLQEVGILKSATHNPLFNNTHTTIIN